MRTLVGIDLGTTRLKAAVFDLDGRLLGHGSSDNPYVDGPRGWAEQDPRSWWSSCGRALRAALAAAGTDPADVAGVGLCGFHHCPVLIDAAGEPVRPVIVTHDGRLGASLAGLEADGVLSEVERLSGSRVLTGHLPPIWRLIRTGDRTPPGRVRWLLLAKDYLRYRLTGAIGTEICDATGTHLVAMPAQGWSPVLGDLLGVPPGILPPIGRPEQVCGTVTPAAALSTGLAAGTPVVHGGGDSHCALLGLGVMHAGEVGLLLGTNSTLRAVFDRPPRCLDRSVWAQQHVVPDRFTLSASSMAGSSVLAWLKETCLDGVSRSEGGIGYGELDALAAGVAPGSDGLLFHPYMHGERSPFYNPRARGSFLGLAHWHSHGYLVRSVMEGVAYSIANCFDALQAAGAGHGQSLHTLRTAASGGARLSTWRQILVDVLDRPLELLAVEEPGCLGAALLAGVGVGEYSDLAAAVARTAPGAGAERLEPDASRAALYGRRREVFNETYRLLEPVLYNDRGEG